MFKREVSDRQLNILGFWLLALCFVPCLLLGEGSVVLAGDQLDGEIFTYLYGAKYLFSGTEEIAEYMGGVSRAALFPPAPLLVVLYRLLPPAGAFFLTQFLVAVTAFFGMNALLKKLGCGKWVAVFTALVFALLPFYSVYGLSVAGLPMLFWAFSCLKEQGDGKAETKSLLPVLLICLYVALSSFVLIGFAVAGCLMGYGLCLLASKNRRWYGMTYGSILLLLVLYLIINRDLVCQVLGIGTVQISHKSEYVLHAQPVAESAWNLFVHGSGHAPSFHAWMILPVLVTLVGGAFLFRSLAESQKKQYGILAACFVAAVLIALFYGVFHGAWMTQIRQRLGGFFVYFQFDRIYWFYPVLWYVMLGLLLMLWQEMGKSLGKKGRHKAGYACRGAAVLFALAAGFTVLWQSDFKKNVRQLYNPESSHAVTWERYYGTGVFGQIKAFIGRETSGYRVASVGLNPAVPAYNGFYTVDGYSNNYALSYKQAFREVIAEELEKDAGLKQYFDDWGNRCYLFSAELGQQYYFEKDDGISIKELSVNTEKLKALGCEYVFAGIPVENAEALGWKLEGIFESDRSECRYRIYLYRLL